MAQNTPGQQLSDLLVTRGFSPEMLDSSGKPAPSAQDAEIFSFDFLSSAGTNYGTVVIMIGEDKQIEIFSGDNVGRGMDSEDKSEWYEFQHQIKNFATKNFMTFGSQNINRLKYSMQGQAALKEGLFESWNGTKNVSWNGGPDSVRLMIRHTRPMGVTESRFRQVESLFVETADGERYKLPFTKLSGGRAMVEHVRQGGKPYDMRGTHIATIVEELNVLSRFRRAAQGKVFEGDTANLVTETNEYYSTLSKTLKGLASTRGYSGYFESWNPADITQQDVIIENIKTLFVQETIDSRIEQALPILARIQQQGNAMKEANIFEAWANRLMEGTWATPDTPEAQQELIALLSSELPVGADATNVTSQLDSLFGDDVLFDQLQDLAAADANADARELIIARMKELADTDTDIGKVVTALDSAMPDDGADQDDELGDYSQDDGDVADQGEFGEDPIDETSVDRIRELSGMAHSVHGGMDNDILQDGVLGSVAGAALGAAAGGLPGASLGATLGGTVQDAMSDDEEVNEGMAGMDNAEPYTIGGAVDKQYVYTVMRDGKSMGIYHSLDDAKSIVANNKRTNQRSEFKVMRKPRSKMSGPVGKLPVQGMDEDVTQSIPMSDAAKTLRHYGADRFKTTSDTLNFYKNGQLFSVDLIMNPDATRSVNLSQLNSVTRSLKGQGMEEGVMGNIANKVMGAAPDTPKYQVGQRVNYETSPHQPDWEDSGRGTGVITAYKNGHYMINGHPVNHFEIKSAEQGMEEGEHTQHYMDANEPNARDYADEKLADIKPMSFKQDPVQATTDRALKYGAKGVDKLRDMFREDDQVVAEDTDQYSVLSGQYGHSGKMQKFDDVEEDILTRLKQLSGMLRSS